MMKKIKLFQVDAFTDKLFSGNPAAVCILDSWIGDEQMQRIADENNLAETAFVVPIQQHYEIRWFTPTVEVDLCGHATLASAFVLFSLIGRNDSFIRFYSPRSGWLAVEKKGEMLYLDFPTDTLEVLNSEQSIAIEKCIGIKPLESLKGKTDYIAVVENETSLLSMQPDFSEISKLKARGLIVTAKGDKMDFVSRFFAPQSGINEDPVTGSAHTSLIPLWFEKSGNTKMIAKQLSKRGGTIYCEYKNERCMIGGNARLYLEGEINID